MSLTNEQIDHLMTLRMIDITDAEFLHLCAQAKLANAQGPLQNLAYELDGVLADLSRIETDKVCLQTIERVRDELNKLANAQEPVECPSCKGSGKEMVTSFADNSKKIEKSCHVCKGKGTLYAAIDAAMGDKNADE